MDHFRSSSDLLLAHRKSVSMTPSLLARAALFPGNRVIIQISSRHLVWIGSLNFSPTTSVFSTNMSCSHRIGDTGQCLERWRRAAQALILPFARNSSYFPRFCSLIPFPGPMLSETTTFLDGPAGVPWTTALVIRESLLIALIESSVIRIA